MIEDKLKKSIIESCTNTEGKLKLTCSAAFKIAEEQDVKLLDITRVLN